MQSLPITSSLLTAAQYDEEKQQLRLTFKSGSSWLYGDAARPFTQADLDGFTGASSAGKYFLENIKGQYPERRG